MKIIKETIHKISEVNTEALMWCCALIYLLLLDPYSTDHLNLCFFDLIGIDFCPGCGLGKSISMLMRGDLINSVKCHPFGIAAFFLIASRIILLLYRKIVYNKHLEEI